MVSATEERNTAHWLFWGQNVSGAGGLLNLWVSYSPAFYRGVLWRPGDWLREGFPGRGRVRVPVDTWTGLGEEEDWECLRFWRGKGDSAWNPGGPVRCACECVCMHTRVHACLCVCVCVTERDRERTRRSDPLPWVQCNWLLMWVKKDTTEVGFPGSSVTKTPAADAGDNRFSPWSWTIPHATEQIKHVLHHSRACALDPPCSPTRGAATVTSQPPP